MAKLKQIVQQLSNPDFESIYYSLIESNAEKSALLLKALRQKQLPDNQVMQELEVNPNAYYTLRSRLYNRIEEYLLQQMESPRANLLKKVATIQEVLFTRSETIAIATLKRLERDLIDYDLFKELTEVYKMLKRLHIHDQEAHFRYSKLYNEHVAFTLALDKAEDLLADYFKIYGSYYLSGDENEKLNLHYLHNEMENVCNMYDSHRLFIYKSCMSVFHRLMVTGEEDLSHHGEPIEDILNKAEEIFKAYDTDIIYFHLKLLFEYLRLIYYNHYKVYRQFEKYYEDVNEEAESLLSFFSLYSFPPHLLNIKIERHLRLGTEHELYEESENIFQFFEPDISNLPGYVNYIIYKAIANYYAGQYDKAAHLVNDLLNQISFRKYPYAQLEIKSILALQYCFMGDMELFNQASNSIQRQIRTLGKDSCGDITLFIKALRTKLNDHLKDRRGKVKALAKQIHAIAPTRQFAPTRLIRLDDSFVPED